ncbi:MAG TPA: hypothetical protein VIK56_11710 [Rhodoferax sp.]
MRDNNASMSFSIQIVNIRKNGGHHQQAEQRGCDEAVMNKNVRMVYPGVVSDKLPR